jgi:pimeloyl-ACP methyl ester carboxylesterase
METVTSKDGTQIVFDKTGQGPAIVLVSAALSSRSDTKKLVEALATQFTVISYDRRGRGESGDTTPMPSSARWKTSSADRRRRGSAYLFGSSSGAVLALDAASRLGDKVEGLVMYEPPFIIVPAAHPCRRTFSAQIEQLLAVFRRSDAVRLFFHKGMGIPGVFVTLMRLLMPGWKEMVGAPVPTTWRSWRARGAAAAARRALGLAHAPTLVMVGSKSEAFSHGRAGAPTCCPMRSIAAWARSRRGDDAQGSPPRCVILFIVRHEAKGERTWVRWYFIIRFHWTVLSPVRTTARITGAAMAATPSSGGTSAATPR